MLDHLARLGARIQRLDEAAAAARKLERQPGWGGARPARARRNPAVAQKPQRCGRRDSQGFGTRPPAKGLPAGPDYFRKLLARSWLEIGQPNRAIETLLAEPRKHRPALADPAASWLLSRAYLQNGQIADASAALKRSGTYRDENPLMPEPSPYTGASRCASCHPEETRTHARSRHARTLHRGPALPRSSVARQTVAPTPTTPGSPTPSSAIENASAWRRAQAIAFLKSSSSTPSAFVTVTSR